MFGYLNLDLDLGLDFKTMDFDLEFHGVRCYFKSKDFKAPKSLVDLAKSKSKSLTFLNYPNKVVGF